MRHISTRLTCGARCGVGLCAALLVAVMLVGSDKATAGAQTPRANAGADALARFIASTGGATVRSKINTLVAEGELTSTVPFSHRSPSLFRFVYPNGLQTLSLAHSSNALGPLYAWTALNSGAWVVGARAGVTQAPVVSGAQLPPADKRNVHIRRSLIELAIGIVPDRLAQAGVISLAPESDPDTDHVALEVSDAYGSFGTLRLNRTSGLPRQL